MAIKIGFEYKTAVCHDDPFRPEFQVQVWSRIYDPQEHIYSMKLTQVTPQEFDLDAGRFLNWSADLKGINIDYVLHTRIDDWFEERLAWIAANVHNPWSFRVEMAHASHCQFSWIFSDTSDAILFKLSF